MQSQVVRVGGTSAIIVAILYIVVSFTYLQWPRDSSPVELMQFLSSTPIVHYIITLGFALIALMMIPVITAMTELLQRGSAGLVRWAAIVGYIGCAGTIMSNLRMLQLVPVRAQVFLGGTEMVQTAIQYNWIGNSLDPDGWLLFGAFGFWTLVMALTALQEGALFPRAYSYLGLAVGGLLMAALLGSLFAPDLLPIAVGLGGLVVAPVWFAWTGILLRRHADTAGGLTRAVS